jgi:hypothetical protein
MYKSLVGIKLIQLPKNVLYNLDQRIIIFTHSFLGIPLRSFSGKNAVKMTKKIGLSIIISELNVCLPFSTGDYSHPALSEPFVFI